MSPSHESIHQLEPSNLLEPINFAEQSLSPVASGTGLEPGGSSRRSAILRERVQPPRRGMSRSLKSALIVAGAVACFGAGAALSHRSTFTSAGLKLSQMDASAIQRPGPVAPARLDQAKPAEPKSNETASSESGQGAGPGGNAAASTEGASPTGMARQWTDPVPAAKDAPPDSSGRGAPSTAGTPAPNVPKPPTTDLRRSDTRTYGRVEDSARSSRDSRRAARRPMADQQPADVNAPTANYSDRRRDRDSKRASNGRRDRYADRNRGDDRNVVELREDGRMMGRESHEEDRQSSRWVRDEGRITGRRVEERAFGRVPREEGPVLTPRGGEGFFGTSAPHRW
jgi:hypothetical protein